MDIDELIELVKLHGKSIYGFCCKLTGNKQDTDDLYQETFLKAVELRLKMDATRNPKAFLISIAIRLHDKLKLPLYMYYTADMTVEEIASALRIPPGTVKSRLHKARKIMRNVLEVDSP